MSAFGPFFGAGAGASGAVAIPALGNIDFAADDLASDMSAKVPEIAGREAQDFHREYAYLLSQVIGQESKLGAAALRVFRWGREGLPSQP